MSERITPGKGELVAARMSGLTTTVEPEVHISRSDASVERAIGK